MSAYIQDENNAESIANDSTVLNATNYGNLTYKVDELQFVLNELHKYKHTTILSSIKDSWASKSWLNTDDGVKSDDSSNYILNGKSVKLTGDAEDDGIHLEKTLDLTTHADAYTAGADDLITFFCYITSADLADLTAGGKNAQLSIGFYDDVLGTMNNYYYSRFDDQLKSGKNIVKLKKSDFSSVGAPDWSTINGIDFYISNGDPNAEIAISIDMILLHTQEFKSFVLKTAQEDVTNSATLQDDDELYVSLPQNGIFEVELNLRAHASDASTDIKCAWTLGGDITLTSARFYQSHNQSVADVNDSSHVKIGVYADLTTALTYGVINGTHSHINEKFVVSTANDGGTLQLRWAQATAVAGKTTAVYDGSYITVKQLQ